MVEPGTSRAAKPREETARRRADILKAAVQVFGNKGFTKGSLSDIADLVGITHAGVLHHFGTKEQLLLEVLVYRDETDVEHLEGRHIPAGLELFRHLVATARLNEQRPGIIQAFTVLSAESVTDDHPAKDYFYNRYSVLRGQIAEALSVICDEDDPPAAANVDAAASAIIAVMDGLQIQWLLDPDAVELAEASAFAIDAILAAAVNGHPRRVL